MTGKEHGKLCNYGYTTKRGDESSTASPKCRYIPSSRFRTHRWLTRGGRPGDIEVRTREGGYPFQHELWLATRHCVCVCALPVENNGLVRRPWSHIPQNGLGGENCTYPTGRGEHVGKDLGSMDLDVGKAADAPQIERMYVDDACEEMLAAFLCFEIFGLWPA